MAGRTYRFFEGEPLFHFGFGLSYTTFDYSDLEVTPSTLSGGESVRVSATVTNCGDMAGDEVVQLYVTDDEASAPVPLRQLQGFTRIHLEPGKSRPVSFTLQPSQMACYTEEGKQVVEPGQFTVSVGGGQPVAGGSATECVTGHFEVAD